MEVWASPVAGVAAEAGAEDARRQPKVAGTSARGRSRERFAGRGSGSAAGWTLIDSEGRITLLFPLFPLLLWAETSRLKKGLRCTQS